MFLHLSVILFTGGVSIHWGYLSSGVSVQEEEVSVQVRGLCPGGGALCRGQGVQWVYVPGSLSRGISVPVWTFDTCDIHSLLILYWYYSIVFHTFDTSNMPFDVLLIV